MWAFGFGGVPVVVNSEESHSPEVPLRADAGQGVENGFWLGSNIHTVIQMSAIPNFPQTVLD